MSYKTKRAKATDIPQKVKRAVWERDGHCVFCGNPYASPNAHYISRAQGGLGIEENVITLCACCHDRYDNSIDRKSMREFFRDYLKSKYPNWKEEDLYYKRF